MGEVLIPESQIHERLGLRMFKPLAIPGRTPKVNLRRFTINQTVFIHRGDVVKLLRTESQTLGGDQVLDRLAELIMEVTT